MWDPATLIAVSAAQRALIFAWGLYQDATMVPKFTDVDYMVFTEAAKFVACGESPYLRETYRYTPLLAWLVLPSLSWFSFGKLLFAVGDLVAGYLVIKMLQNRGYSTREACMYSSVWLLNPMVSAISVRGSSEGLLGAMVVFMVWALEHKRYMLSGVMAGLAIHFKIYPVIYVPTIIWSLGPVQPQRFVNQARVRFGLGLVASFAALTYFMYYVYGYDYLQHSWLHHLTRLDHRHNFSVYSTALYFSLANPQNGYHFEQWAFVPQLLLSGLILPLCFARKDMVKTMFVQTFTFVTFNKVCTSQYFIWYIALLPFYIGALRKAGPVKYVFAALWVLAQGLWLRYAFQLEFLGQSVFYPQVFAATVVFFAVNVWGICLLIDWL